MAKRRTFTPDFKAQVVLEELTGVKSKAEICRERLLKPQIFSHWRTEFLDRAPEIFATNPSRGDEQERIAELERMVGRLTMQLEAAKKPPTCKSDVIIALGGTLRAVYSRQTCVRWPRYDTIDFSFRQEKAEISSEVSSLPNSTAFSGPGCLPERSACAGSRCAWRPAGPSGESFPASHVPEWSAG